MSVEVDVTVDTKGLKCPEPLMVVRNKMMDIEKGQVMMVVATDPSTSWDFTNYCKFLNHEMVHQESSKTEYRYWIRKG